MKNDEIVTPRQLAAIQHIRNWIAHEQRTPTVRELMAALGYKSPRSVQDLLAKLSERGIIEKRQNGNFRLVVNPDLNSATTRTASVPVIGTVAAGTPILAEENFEDFVSVSTSLAKPGSKYFLLHVKGDSMDEVGIKDGDLVLVRQQSVAEEGQNVVALIDNEATIKEFHRSNDLVVLKPRSTNKQNKPIIVSEDLQIQGVVVAAIPKLERI